MHPKALRDKYHITKNTEVKLVPKVEGILIKPRVRDPVGRLKGIAKGVWPESLSSVDHIRDLRRRADFEAREKL